ncbi:hypothetical protein [Campylobacter sp. RM16190]|uniref:hypothetical protein n=1 Tax=Campylobacter sp. RM16190 TaxID=1705727 RepID=UPI001476516D|nr:hypothetical protein [Campylobacter sp. RM16190]
MQLLGQIGDMIDDEVESLSASLKLIQLYIGLAKAKLALYDVKNIIKSKLSKLSNGNSFLDLHINENLRKILNEF